MGYTHVYAPDLNRTDYTRPLSGRAPAGQPCAGSTGDAGGAIDEAVGKLNDLDSGSLVQKNRVFYRLAAKRRHGEVCTGRGRAVGDRAAGGL